MEMNGVGRRKTELFNDLRNRRRYWGLKEKVKIEKDGNNSLSHVLRKKYKLSYKSMDLLTTSIVNDDDDDDDDNAIIIIIVIIIVIIIIIK